MALEGFHRYLVGQNYMEYTPSGNRSTVFDYCKRITDVCTAEEISPLELAKNINTYVKKYDVGGIKETTGKIGHNSVINALKRFKEYVEGLK